MFSYSFRCLFSKNIDFSGLMLKLLKDNFICIIYIIYFFLNDDKFTQFISMENSWNQ